MENKKSITKNKNKIINQNSLIVLRLSNKTLLNVYDRIKNNERFKYFITFDKKGKKIIINLKRLKE